MANRDKGRRKWGGFLQDNSKLEKDRSMGMRGGGNRASQALYRPGSGPLRKSGRSTDDLDNENISQEKPKSSSVQHRLKQSQLNRSNQSQNSPPSSQVENVTEKLNDLNINYRSITNIEQAQSSSQNNPGDSRRKIKKPEQQLYVPKKVKEALAEQDVTNRSPNQGGWERDQEREHSEDRDSHSNRSHKSDNQRNRSSGHTRRDSESGTKNRDEHGKRYSGNRRNRHGNENEERWRSDSPLSSRGYGNRKDNSREVRQGSEPLFVTTNHLNDFNRTRDTRSVEPAGHAEKFQGKPPSGKWGSAKDSLPKNIKIEHLPPRLQKKYLLDNGLPLPPSSSPSEDSWNINVSFQASSNYNFPPAIQHSQTMQNLPPSGPLPPQSNWSNTAPSRTRGRGRLRPEDLESSTNIFRCVTPDQYSAPSSRSHTPSQEYMQRSYDRRGSNSTMYTSMESLSRVDSSVLPSSASPVISVSNVNKRQTSPENHRRGISPSATLHRTQTQRVNNTSDRNITQEKKNDQQNSSISSLKNEIVNITSNISAEHPFDWSEEVELSEKLEAERASRSSSVLSLRENVNVSGNETTSNHSRRKKKKREKKHVDRGRSNSRDKTRVNSRDRQNNQQNRENDNYNNNQKNSSSSRRYDHRRHRNIIQRSRESSKDRNYRGGNRNFDDLHRHRLSDRYLDENWRTGRKMSICDSDDGRQTPNISSHSISLSNTLSTHQTSPSGYTSSQPPGVLVLPDTSQSPPSHPVSRQQGTQQQRTLFDPNNPNKPIVITSPSSRAVVQRETETISQGSTIPVFQSHGGITSTHHSFQGAHLDGVPPPYMTNDQFGNIRPSWYDPYSDSFRLAKNPYLLLDIERADLELQWILSSGGFTSNWERVLYIRHFLQESLKTLLETDIKFCQAENVEQHFWKILFYNMIEMLRKGMPKESSEGREHYKKIMLQIIDDGTVYLESLLTVLETKYEFKLDTFLASSTLPKGLGILGLALVSAQKIYLFLGDLARYREQANETNNYGKSRQWYLKAQQLNPKNGRPYNQLALLAHYARRKLDAVYYYMRSLMASNPFHSARESLIALFDENRKKYESTERKRKEEREWKERARMKEKEGANSIGGGLRREIWVHPGGRRVRRTTTAATANEARLSHSDLEELAQLSSVEVNKRFVTSYLHVHGKLINKIGMETFQEAGVQMLKEFRALLQHSPLPLPGTRLLQLLALNMFAIESTQLKDSQMEQGYRSEVQERALVVSLQMFNLILERGVSLLKSQLDSGEEPRMVVSEDMQVLLPAIKIWCDWMLCHSTVWNPPPSCTDYRVGPPGDAWSRLATMVNLLEKLNYSRMILIQAKDAEGREDELELVKLPEDMTLAGFTPLMSNPQDPCYAEKNEDMEVAQVCLRINKILFFGQVFLCGLETPVLKLQKSETGVSEYVSVVEASSTSTPSSPPEQSDSELLVESYSEGEDEPVSTMRRLPLCTDVPDDSTAPVAAVEIRSLIERKEELERRQRKQDRHRQRVQQILQKSSVSVEIEVRPRQLVPDTNCFIDYLPQLQNITKAVSGAQPIYTLMVPLVVLNELEGLARGADARDCPPASRATLDPEHVARVAESAKAALAFARSRNPAIRCLTTRGTVLTSSTFTVEEDVDKDGLTRNDDRILATCLSLCKAGNKDQANAEEGQPRRLRREVVLLTEDRNLRVKALARDVPVREVPDFMQWAGLG
ncbi:telomerase-binding protein EST1A isoform X2 [Apis mellifera]|uniref:Telomerase-binding protein EST1A isoform X2 n=1 Tax=Apis mellifera TaxID=7460 RepID=A0A7M7R6I9_APIME|nr:telomerase-binding protein EST1A isoform X2 [Apis mellifera]|eukprot:XP_393289.4 telomerase-binding protein EST1A isoform X2 [Apis mellifera]